jgi:hypothetical protein
MKTSKNLNQIAKVTFASVTFLFASLMPMQAASGKNTASEMNEIQAASNQLAMFNNEIEKTVAFNAPVEAEEYEAFELFVAESMLDDMFTNVSMDAAYVSPSVNEDFETAEAMGNLDTLNAQIEQSVKYTPATIAE